MPVFKVETSDGGKFEIDAPDEATAIQSWTAAQSQRGFMDKLLGSTGPRYQVWPERAVRSMAESAKQLVDEAGTARPGSRELTENLTGPARETAMMFGPRVPRSGLPAYTTPSREAIGQAANMAYEKGRNLEVEFHPKALGNLAFDIQTKLNGMGLDDKLAPQTFRILNDMGKVPAGGYVTPANLDTLRKTLGNVAGNFRDPVDQKAAMEARKHLDAYLAAVPAGDVRKGDAGQVSRVFGEARGNYAASKRAEELAGVLQGGEQRAEVANSGLNLGNVIRQEAHKLRKSDERSAGFSPEEMAQLNRVAGGTAVGNTSRRIANMAGAGGGLGQTALSLAGGGIGFASGGLPGAGYGVGAGAMAPIMIGSAARSLHEASVKRQLRKLDEMIRNRSPLAEALREGSATQHPGQNAAKMALVRALIANQYAPQEQP